ncbi:hypothetical protein [Kytococcus sp. Marseille-QA3725]
MNAPARPPHERAALLWFGTAADRVTAWAASGVTSLEVAHDRGWSVARPTTVPEGLGPYGDGMGLCLGRSLPPDLLPLVAMTEREDLLVVAAAVPQDPTLRWVAVLPGAGPRSVGDLPVCGPRLLTEAAGRPELVDEVAALVARGRGAGGGPGALGARLARLLGLPGAGGMRRPGPLPGGVLVEPDAREVRRFVSVVSDRVVDRSEEDR